MNKLSVPNIFIFPDRYKNRSDFEVSFDNEPMFHFFREHNIFIIYTYVGVKSSIIKKTFADEIYHE